MNDFILHTLYFILNFMRILGIETSCDETGVAVFDDKNGLLAHALHSQVKLHAQYGGVVPELASRDHVRKLLPLVKEVLNMAKIEAKDLSAIAYTKGPGLIGALLVGAAFAESLAFSLGIPTVPINHMEAHLLAPLLEENKPEFPFLALLVSGGHTQLVHVAEINNYRIVGESVDDAVGEAFDKVAKILGLSYPGGPLLEKLATKGDSKRFYFPRPMVNRKGLDFSFSGLKTYALNCFNEYIAMKKKFSEGGGTNRTEQNYEQTRADIARAFQDSVTNTLAIKCRRALRQENLKRLVVAGGVSANSALREALNAMAKKEGAEVYYPRIAFCSDNGAMIAYAGYRRFLIGDINMSLMIKVDPRLRL